MRNEIESQLHRVVLYGSLGALSILLIAEMVASLSWLMEHDQPLLHYTAYLMDQHGMMPYRDFFETSMPGTFLFHLLIVKLVGYGDLAFRVVDLLLLGVVSSSIFVFMRRFGTSVAWAAAVVFGLVYLKQGPTFSLQRDYVGLVPIAVALMVIPVRSDQTGRLLRYGVLGFLFGLSSLFKPHLAMGLPVFVGVLLMYRGAAAESWRSRLIWAATASSAGFLLPWAAVFSWLVIQQAWPEFWFMVSSYLPLHNALSGGATVQSGALRAYDILWRTLSFRDLDPLVLSAMFAWNLRLANKRPAVEVLYSLRLVFACALIYAFYPTIAGKFWDYHYAPVILFMVLASSLLLMNDKAGPNRSALRLASLLVFLLAIQLYLDLPKCIEHVVNDLQAETSHVSSRRARAEEIARWLETRLEPGDTVQPLDWVDGGAVHAMLLSEALLATRFLYDYHFYHHVSTDVNRRLRRTFISELAEKQPRFIIDVQDFKLVPSGHDTSPEFPELEAFIARGYRTVQQGVGYRILERISSGA